MKRGEKNKKREKEQNKQEGIAGLIQEKCVTIYLTGMLLVFPLYYRNNYIDILSAKRSAYLNMTLIWLVFMLFLSAFGIGEGERREPLDRSGKIILILAAVEAGTLVISTLFSEHRKDAFLGLTGRYLGSLAMLMGLLSMLLIAAYLRWGIFLNWVFLAGSGIVYFLQICNTWGWDILRMQADVAREEQMIFISTIGNINFNASFNAMMLPAGMVFYMLCKERLSRWIYAGYLLLGFMGSIACRSDSVYLGLGAAFLVLLVAACKREEFPGRWIEEILIFLAAATLMYLVSVRFHRGYELDGLSLAVTDVRFLIAGFLCAGAGRCLLLWKGISKEKKKGLLTALGIVLLIGLLLWGRRFFLPEQGGYALSFPLPDTWGNNRGYVWNRCLGIFHSLPLREKLFGCGMNAPSYLLEEFFGAEMRQVFPLVFIDAHNEALQLLLSIGAVGTCCYFGMLFVLFATGIRLYRGGEETALFILGAIPAFLAQGLVNNPQIATTPLMFVGMGIFFNICQRGKHSEK